MSDATEPMTQADMLILAACLAALILFPAVVVGVVV